MKIPEAIVGDQAPVFIHSPATILVAVLTFTDIVSFNHLALVQHRMVSQKLEEECNASTLWMEYDAIFFGGGYNKS